MQEMGQYIAADMQLKEPACSLYSFTSASRAATSPLIVADSVDPSTMTL